MFTQYYIFYIPLKIKTKCYKRSSLSRGLAAEDGPQAQACDRVVLRVVVGRTSVQGGGSEEPIFIRVETKKASIEAHHLCGQQNNPTRLHFRVSMLVHTPCLDGKLPPEM